MHKNTILKNVIFYPQSIESMNIIPGLLLNFLTGLGVPELNVGWETFSGILRPLLINELLSLGPTTPLRLRGKLWRFPNLTSDLGAAETALTILGKGFGILVVVLGVVVDFVGGGPQIKSKIKWIEMKFTMFFDIQNYYGLIWKEMIINSDIKICKPQWNE